MSPRSKNKPAAPPPQTVVMTNADIAQRLAAMGQLLAARGENPFKVKAYRRAAETITGLPESIDALVRADADLTVFSGIGKGIAGALREIVLSGSLAQLDTLRAAVAPEVAELSAHPKLNPQRVLEVYKKLKISSLAALQEKLENGEAAKKLHPRTLQHLRTALSDDHERLLIDADALVAEIKRFLASLPGVKRVEATGEVRRRVETIGGLSFLLVADDFDAVVKAFQGYGGRAKLVSEDAGRASFEIPAGIGVTLEAAPAGRWGLALLVATGSPRHLELLSKGERSLHGLTRSAKKFATENSVYRELALSYVEPELRSGTDEVERATRGALPRLVAVTEIKGELHAHTTSSDGAHSIEQMAEAARARGYEYLGITDHSRSLKIAGGLSEEELREQIRKIEKLNTKMNGFRILKSAEVDILADGSLDYPDALLRELDYTVCSIHSRFSLTREQQTTRLMRAMDNPYFTILGHATGRLLLRRPGYEIDIERVVAHAEANGCFFEINASPDRLDLRWEHARLARAAGVKIAISTDAHSIAELDYLRCGIDEARRAGLEKSDTLNCHRWPDLEKTFSARRK
jgi:DNA polymerase (family X)